MLKRRLSYFSLISMALAAMVSFDPDSNTMAWLAVVVVFAAIYIAASIGASIDDRPRS